MRKVEIVDYDHSWPVLFEKERKLLQNILGDIAKAIHHIGSTSVPGLAAKPIIDILMEVTSVNTLDGFNDELFAVGYEARGEFGIPGRRYFKKGGNDRTHHIHAFNSGDFNLTRHLAFRDYLRHHPDVASEYAALKMEIAAACNNDIYRYCEGKDVYVKRVEARAVEEMTSEE